MSTQNQSILIQQLRHNLAFSTRPQRADAAVLIAITNELEPRVLFTRRAHNLNNHAGEVSFVGGKQDAADTSNIVTALREAQEEVGLDPFSVQLLGELPRTKARNGMFIKAIIGLIPPDVNLIASPNEIGRIFFIPLTYFLNNQPTPYSRMFYNRKIQMPSFQTDGEVIWGLTGRLLVETINVGLHKKISWPLVYSHSIPTRLIFSARKIRSLFKHKTRFLNHR